MNRETVIQGHWKSSVVSNMVYFNVPGDTLVSVESENVHGELLIRGWQKLVSQK